MKGLTCIKDIDTGAFIFSLPSCGAKLGCLLIVADLSGFVVADHHVHVAGLLNEADGALLGEGLVTHLSLQIDETHG